MKPFLWMKSFLQYELIQPSICVACCRQVVRWRAILYQFFHTPGLEGKKVENVIISAKSYIINPWSKHLEVKRLARSKNIEKITLYPSTKPFGFHKFKSVKKLVQNLLLYTKEYSTPPKMKSNFVPVFSHSWASRQKGWKRHNFS